MSDDSAEETIGPYRVLGQIGKGGMGEVLLARDPRLGRKVAIKRIRAGGDPDARRRFQREARLAAGLSHPAIVPVFDLVVEGEHEHLVMELVEGPSLTRWLAEDRPLAAKLRIAEQVAAGLAYAHRQGIVHRDLKTENVLLTVDEQAKIADFGIARRDQTGPLADLTTEAGVEVHTREGAMLGTCRSMAPEQARGELVDARSDLFSFGVLLYEMFAGESPFRAVSPLETLLRLVGRPHPPIDALVPGLPPALVRLIDQLLEKDPGLRPRSAEEVLHRLEALRRELEEGLEGTLTPGSPAPAQPVAPVPIPTPSPPARRWAWLALLLLPAIGTAGWLWWPSPEPIYVAVLPPRLESVDPVDEGVRQRLIFDVRGDLARSLGALSGVSPLSAVEVDQAVAAQPSADHRELAEALGADELIVSAISCLGSDCRLSLERRRPRDGSVVTPEPVELPLQEPAMASKAVRVATRARLFPELSARRGSDPLAGVAEDDYAALLRVRQELSLRPASDRLDAWLDELKAIRERNPTLIEASLLEVETAWRRYSDTHDTAYRERAQAAISAAIEQAPESPEVFLMAAWLATVDGRPGEVEELLTRAERLAPGDLRVLDSRALLLETQGRPEAALDLWRQALERRPSWRRSFLLASTLFQLNRWQESGRVLDGLLEKAPEHRPASTLRAKIELTAGDPRKAVELFEALLARWESFGDRANLATAYLLVRDGAGAAREIGKVLVSAPDHPYYLLTLADARLLEGRPAEAERLYRRVAVALDGEEDWQSLGVRAQVHAQLGEADKALALLDQAKRLAPKDDGEIAFMAALVYTLVGERGSAKLNIQLAAERGWGGWLRLAPFDAWRDDPEIGPLLGAAISGSTSSTA